MRLNYSDIVNLPTPTIILSHHTRGKYGNLIKRFTGADITHAMILMHGNRVITQNLVIKEKSISHYVENDYYLEFYANPNWGEDERIIATSYVESRLNAPLSRRVYDFLGILGQATNLRWLQSPKNYYCSECVAELLNLLGEEVPRRMRPIEIRDKLRRVL